MNSPPFLAERLLRAEPRPGPSEVAANEVLAALSRALDLTEGQPLGHSIRACLIGMRLGESAGMGQEALADLYYALLLKDAGCSNNASRMSGLFGTDDRALKPALKVADWDSRIALAATTWRYTGMQQSLWTRLRYFIGVAQQENLTKNIIEARCERGADIAHRLGFPPATVEGIRSLDEHWNGKGYPRGLQGTDIPLISRIVNIAQTVEVFLSTGGPDAVDRVLRERSGRWFEPTLVQEVLRWTRDAAFWGRVQAHEAQEHVLSLEPGQRVRMVDARGLDTIAESFADIIDAKSPYTFRHSSQVALYAAAIGKQMGFSHEQLVNTRRAGLLHDIGKVGISNRILDKTAALTAEERALVNQHPAYTWDILSRVPAFATFAREAATHHEKLDGSGYPWGIGAYELDTPARLLVVADIYEALTANRPYRSGMAPDDALALLNRDRGTKLDGAAIDALAAALTDLERETL